MTDNIHGKGVGCKIAGEFSRAMPDRTEQIVKWLERFKRSGHSARAFFAKYRVPFSPTQFHRYLRVFDDSGRKALADGRAHGNNRRIHSEAEGFLVGYLAAHEQASEEELRREVREHFDVEVTQSGMSRCLKRLGIGRDRSARAGTCADSTGTLCGFRAGDSSGMVLRLAAMDRTDDRRSAGASQAQQEIRSRGRTRLDGQEPARTLHCSIQSSARCEA